MARSLQAQASSEPAKPARRTPAETHAGLADSWQEAGPEEVARIRSGLGKVFAGIAALESTHHETPALYIPIRALQRDSLYRGFRLNISGSAKLDFLLPGQLAESAPQDHAAPAELYQLPAVLNRAVEAFRNAADPRPYLAEIAGLVERAYHDHQSLSPHELALRFVLAGVVTGTDSVGSMWSQYQKLFHEAYRTLPGKRDAEPIPFEKEQTAELHRRGADMASFFVDAVPDPDKREVELHTRLFVQSVLESAQVSVQRMRAQMQSDFDSAAALIATLRRAAAARHQGATLTAWEDFLAERERELQDATRLGSRPLFQGNTKTAAERLSRPVQNIPGAIDLALSLVAHESASRTVSRIRHELLACRAEQAQPGAREDIRRTLLQPHAGSRPEILTLAEQHLPDIPSLHAGGLSPNMIMLHAAWSRAGSSQPPSLEELQRALGDRARGLLSSLVIAKQSRNVNDPLQFEYSMQGSWVKQFMVDSQGMRASGTQQVRDLAARDLIEKDYILAAATGRPVARVYNAIFADKEHHILHRLVLPLTSSRGQREHFLIYTEEDPHQGNRIVSREPDRSGLLTVQPEHGLLRPHSQIFDHWESMPGGGIATLQHMQEVMRAWRSESLIVTRAGAAELVHAHVGQRLSAEMDVLPVGSRVNQIADLIHRQRITDRYELLRTGRCVVCTVFGSFGGEDRRQSVQWFGVPLVAEPGQQTPAAYAVFPLISPAGGARVVMD